MSGHTITDPHLDQQWPEPVEPTDDGPAGPGPVPDPGPAFSAAGPRSAPPVWDPGPAERPVYFDVAGMLDGGMPDPPATDVLARTDGVCIFYAGQVNLLFGDPESGKTFVALAAAAEALRLGRSALVLDLDHNGPEATISRLAMLGAPESALRDLSRFRYVEPEDALHVGIIVSDAKDWHPTVVVVDSLGELLPVFGASSNSPDDFTMVHARVMKPLAMTGACVICIDHLAKNAESRAHGSTGTAAKRRAIGGTSIRVKVADTFVPGHGGSAHLLIHKDRHGGLREHSPREDSESIGGTFTMTVDAAGGTSWKVAAPAMTDRNPDELPALADVEAVAALDPAPTSVEDARGRLRWRKPRATAAVREWRKQGSESTGPRSHTQGADPGPAPVIASCASCGGSMRVVEPGQTVHPGCPDVAS